MLNELKCLLLFFACVDDNSSKYWAERERFLFSPGCLAMMDDRREQTVKCRVQMFFCATLSCALFQLNDATQQRENFGIRHFLLLQTAAEE
jgi:hypothetical protein